MKAPKKIAGFFIVEILIVLVIVGILVTALLPNLKTYTQRAQYIDNVSAAGAIKASVEACMLQNPTATTNCDSGSNGIPTYAAPYGSFVNTVTVANGVITVASQPVFGSTNTDAFNYVLTPTTNASGTITWTDNSTDSTCKPQGLC